MKRIEQMSALVAAGMMAGGCMHLSAHAQTVERTVDEYTAIELNGAADVHVTIGDDYYMKIEGPEDRLENLTTTVEDGVLTIGEDSTGFFTSGNFEIWITMQAISAFTLSGAGDVDIEGVAGESFELTVRGAGDIDVSGEVDSATISLSGAGDIDARELIAKNVTVSVRGAGDVDVYASESITATVKGVGDVTYFGDPETVTSDVKGVGDISAGK